MQTESVFTTLLAAAACFKKPLQDVASQSLKDAYDATKAHLRKKLNDRPEAIEALEVAVEKPESSARKAVLLEETESAGLESDAELARLIAELAALLPQAGEMVHQNVRVTGRSNKVLVAGRDVISAERHIMRSAITPDERHITAEQRRKISGVIAELAARLADENGRSNFAAGHRMIQHRFEIASYVLLPRDKFHAALDFLKQRRAAYRTRLRFRNPALYNSDLFRAVFSGAGELGWDRQQVYGFATEKLGLKNPVTSLKQLGPVQLKSLVDSMHRQVAKVRATVGSTSAMPEARQENS